MAIHHGLAPLFFKRLKQSDVRVHVPEDAWERLRLAYFAGTGRNKRIYRELRPVLRRLVSERIPVIVLKGAYLAEAVYGDVAVRPMGDVDLMVPRAELFRAQATLLGMGGVRRLSSDEELLDWRRHHHVQPVVVRDVAIEIHWTIVPPNAPVRVDAAGLWDRAHPVTIAGVEVLALSPEDLLLHLCLHFGCDNRFGGLKSLCDIDETIHHFGGKMGWALVVHLAREWEASRYVGLTLHLARSMLGAGVPDEVLERLTPGGFDRRILETARESALVPTYRLQSLALIDRWGAMSLRDKAKLSWERVFLSRDEMAEVYPASRNSRHLSYFYMLRLRDVIRTFSANVRRRGSSTAGSRGQDRNAALVNWLRSGKP